MPTVIIEQIKILAELQKIDVEIHRFRKELDEYPAIQKKYEADLKQKKNRLKTVEDDFKRFQLTQKEKEGELQSKEDKIIKLQGQLYQLKSNKEYAAMEIEIKGLKADKSVLEEEILRFLDSVDTERSKVVKEKEIFSQEEKKFKTDAETLKKKSDEIQASIAVLEEKRKNYAPNIDPKLLGQYEKILKKRDGLAIVPVRNNACGGCHMELPPQIVNEIQMQDKWITCESCARILYWMP